MKITTTMNICDLAQHMGSVATDAQASAMRELLVATHAGGDTEEIDQGEWLAMSEQAVSNALQSSEGVLAAAGVTLSDLLIRGHQDGYAWLGAKVEDGRIVAAEWRADVDGNESYIDAEWHVLRLIGTGSCPCNCDACLAGDDPNDWAGSDADAASALQDEIDEAITRAITA